MRWSSHLYILLVLATLLSHQSAFCQHVPVDTAEVMLGVVQSLRAQGQMEDADRLLELIVRLYPESMATQIAARSKSDTRTRKAAGSGNTELIVYSTFYGAALGVIIPGALGADSPEPYGAGILLGAPAGYGLSKLYTNWYPVTAGQARAMTFGTWWGSLQGLGWREVFDIGDHTETYCYDFEGETQCFESGTVSDRAPYVATIVGGLAGLAAGTMLGRAIPISGRTALITNFSAIWGGWYGAVLGVQIDPTRDDEFSSDDGDSIVATMLTAGNVGLLAGALAGPSLNWSSGDAWAVHLSGIAGLIGGLGIDLLASVETTETGLLIPGLTSAAALGVAAALVGSRNATASSDRGQRFSAVDYSEGRWSVGVPTPMPTILADTKNGVRVLRPAAQVSLVRMRW